MKKKMTELQKRVLTGSIGGISLISLLIWGNELVTYALITFFASLLAQEYAQAFLKKKRLFLIFHQITLQGLLLYPSHSGLILALSFILLFSAFLLDSRLDSQQLSSVHQDLLYAQSGLIYVGLLPSCLFFLTKTVYGNLLLISFLLMVFQCDVFAYFFGKKFGKKKIFALISPQKTWIGAFAGLIACMISFFCCQQAFLKEIPLQTSLLIGLSIGVSCQIGDFCESFLKRVAGKKDFGTLLPGHGGMLDRFDGVIFSAPVMLFFIHFLEL
jgi:phosphatidate cytidylyltransferase